MTQRTVTQRTVTQRTVTQRTVTERQLISRNERDINRLPLPLCRNATRSCMGRVGIQVTLAVGAGDKAGTAENLLNDLRL